MKAILVIDIPLSIDCEDLGSYEAELKIIDKDEDEYVLSKRHLSLKPMPRKIVLSQCELSSTVRYATGWNDCIDEILEEKDERND